MMKELISDGYYEDDGNNKRILGWLGYNIGKWVYIIDAYDDLEKDIKNKCYNSLVLQFAYDGQDINEFRASISSEVKSCLTHTMWQASNALELLRLDNKGIIDNIVYEGMYKKMESILDKRSCKKHG